MKKLLAAVIFGLSGMASAADIIIAPAGPNSFAGDLTQETALAYNKTFAYDLGHEGVTRISAMVEYGSATPVASTFTDGRTSSGTITIVSTVSLCGTNISVNGKYFNFCGVAPYNPNTYVKMEISRSTSIANSTTTAAQSLLYYITHNAATMYITTGTASYGVISLVSVAADGVAYALTSSSPALVRLGGPAMGLGSAAKVTTSDVITVASHGYTTGLPLGFTGTISGLTNQTTYYAIRVDANNIKLSSTSALAQAGTAVDITAVPATASASTYRLDPVAIGGTPSFKWQHSNDNVSWLDTSISSVTVSSYTNPYATTGFDFKDVDFRFLRLNVIAPTTGGMLLNTWMYIKRSPR